MKSINYYGIGLEIIDPAEKLVRISSALDPYEFNLAHNLLQYGDRCLVAGAGLGSVGIWACVLLGPRNVVMYEALPQNVDFMARNIRFDGADLPNVFWAALSTQKGSTKLYVKKVWTGSTLHELPEDDEQYKEVIDVPTLDINDVIRHWSINALMLDVEGAEQEMIPHIDWSPIRCIGMEMHGTREQARNNKKILSDAGFDIEFYKDHKPTELQHIGAVRFT